MFLKGHGGAKKKFVGEAFNVVGMWEKLKTVGGGLKNRGGAPEIHGGVISWGLLQRVFESGLLSRKVSVHIKASKTCDTI